MLRFEFLAPPTKVYSPECVEGKFLELRLLGVLGSSPPALWWAYR
jgi:hypothetical protein